MFPVGPEPTATIIEAGTSLADAVADLLQAIEAADDGGEVLLWGAAYYAVREVRTDLEDEAVYIVAGEVRAAWVRGF